LLVLVSGLGGLGIDTVFFFICRSISSLSGKSVSSIFELASLATTTDSDRFRVFKLLAERGADSIIIGLNGSSLKG